MRLTLLAAAILLVQPAFAQDPFAELYAPRSDWTATGQEEVMIGWSTFIYRDINENGEYDVGDRPMAGVYSTLFVEGVPVAIKESNRSGFANFEASVSHPDALIDAPGEISFNVAPPPGWFVTSGNDVQIRHAVLSEGSPGGMAIENQPYPIGLAPQKSIRGLYNGAEPAVITLSRGGDVLASIERNPGEAFSFVTDRGDFVLSDGKTDRPVSVSENPVHIGTFGPMPSLDGITKADFEGIIDADLRKIENGRYGLNWFNLNLIRWDHVTGAPGYRNGVSSGTHLIYTSSALPGEISRDQPFTLVSMSLTNTVRESEGEYAVIELYSGDELIQRDWVRMTRFGPVSYQPMRKGVTRVRIYGQHFWHIAIDDVVIAD